MSENEVLELAKTHMEKWGLVTDGWIAQWEDELPSSTGPLAGHTDCDEKIIRYSRQFVPEYEVDRVEYMTLHEIAHALAGKGAGHGPEWEAVFEGVLEQSGWRKK